MIKRHYGLDQRKMGTSDELVAAKDDPTEFAGSRIGLPEGAGTAVGCQKTRLRWLLLWLVRSKTTKAQIPADFGDRTSASHT